MTGAGTALTSDAEFSTVNFSEQEGNQMPFINVKTNVSVTEDKAESIKSLFGQAITAIPGKSEAWLMVEIESERRLWFKGNIR